MNSEKRIVATGKIYTEVVGTNTRRCIKILVSECRSA